MKRLAALFLLLCASARADIALEIKAQLAPFEVLRGDFLQTKHIKIIKRPLKSSGNFVLLRGKGVLWNTMKPMASTMKVTRDEITQIKEGKVGFTLKAGEQPALKLVGDVLFAVFSADVEELKRHFEISGSVQGGNWQARLLPKEAWVAKAAKEIRLKGGKALESLEIDEANGDHTAIQFVHVNLKSSLKASEKTLFE